MKTFARVWGECKSLTRLECRVFMLHHNRMPLDLNECDHRTALLLYLADMLRFEKMDTNTILCILRHFMSDLDDLADTLQERFEARSPSVPVWRLSVFDDRFVSIIGSKEYLDLTDGSVAILIPSETRTVIYNLSTLMLRRWADSVSPRAQTPETSDGADKPPEGATP